MIFERFAFYRGEVYDILSDSWEIVNSSEGMYPNENFTCAVILYTDERCFKDDDILTVMPLYREYQTGDVRLTNVAAGLEGYFIRPTAVIDVYKVSLGDRLAELSCLLMDYLEEQTRYAFGAEIPPIDDDDFNDSGKYDCYDCEEDDYEYENELY